MSGPCEQCSRWPCQVADDDITASMCLGMWRSPKILRDVLVFFVGHWFALKVSPLPMMFEWHLLYVIIYYSIYIYITIITLYIKERCICRFFTSGRTRFLIGVPGYLNLEPSTGKPCRRWLQVSLWSPCGWKPVFFIWYISMILYVSY